ncbi:MAG TPA: glycosyltransferase, partial [Gemmatimonadaceae bacterium]|nr:glycosyltransferase [Gemmatimonadaceae bacterium]
MKVLVIGSGKHWRMERCTERALKRAGHKTLLVDDKRAQRTIGRKLTQKWALSRTRSFKPDHVILGKCHGLDLETVSTILKDRPSSMWYHDPQWYKSTYRPDIAHIVAVGKMTQTFFVSGFDKEWKGLGLPAKFLPSAADRDIRPVPYQDRYHSDVSFIGTGYDASRAQFLLKVAKKYDLRVWGKGWEEWRKPLKWSGRPVEGKTFAAVCTSSKISLGINPDRARGGSTYTSDRTWMVILAGGFYLGHGTPGLTEMLREGDHCAWYQDIESCLAKIGYYLENAASRERIRREGQSFVREHHTFDQRVDNLLTG